MIIAFLYKGLEGAKILKEIEPNHLQILEGELANLHFQDNGNSS